MSLLACPPDVLSRLFTYLDGYTLMRCKEICRQFAETISSDIYAQYALELYKSGMLDLEDTNKTKSIPTIDRLNRLREYLSSRSAWDQTGPTKTLELPNMSVSPSQFEYSHGLYVALPLRKPRVLDFWRFLELNPTDQKDLEHDPVVHESTGGYTEHCIDRDQDLLVLAAIRRGGTSETAWLNILSLSTGRPHPEAASPYIKLPYRVDTFFSIHLDLYGSRVLVCDSVDGSYWGWDIYIYDWKTGELITHTQMIPDHGFSFLNEDYLIGCLRVKNQNALELRVYPVKTGTAPDCLLILQIPAFRDKLDFESEIESFPENSRTSIPPTNQARYHRNPFHSDPQNAVMSLHIDCEGEWSLVCVFQRSGILDLIDTNSSGSIPRTIKWGTWPQSFIVLPYHIALATYGSRLAVAIPEQDVVDVYDFHPRWWTRRFEEVDGEVFDVAKVKTIPMPLPKRMNIDLGDGDVEVHMDESLLVVGSVRDSKGMYHIFRS